MLSRVHSFCRNHFWIVFFVSCLFVFGSFGKCGWLVCIKASVHTLLLDDVLFALTDLMITFTANTLLLFNQSLPIIEHSVVLMTFWFLQKWVFYLCSPAPARLLYGWSPFCSIIIIISYCIFLSNLVEIITVPGHAMGHSLLRLHVFAEHLVDFLSCTKIYHKTYKDGYTYLFYVCLGLKVWNFRRWQCSVPEEGQPFRAKSNCCTVLASFGTLFSDLSHSCHSLPFLAF